MMTGEFVTIQVCRAIESNISVIMEPDLRNGAKKNN